MNKQFQDWMFRTFDMKERDAARRSYWYLQDYPELLEVKVNEKVANDIEAKIERIKELQEQLKEANEHCIALKDAFEEQEQRADFAENELEVMTEERDMLEVRNYEYEAKIEELERELQVKEIRLFHNELYKIEKQAIHNRKVSKLEFTSSNALDLANEAVEEFKKVTEKLFEVGEENVKLLEENIKLKEELKEVQGKYLNVLLGNWR